MEMNKLKSPGRFGCSGDLYKIVFKSINCVEQNHLHNGRRDTVPTPQVVELKEFFEAAAAHLAELLPAKKKGAK